MLQDDGVGDEDERGGGGGMSSRQEPLPVQHTYSTRRAEARDMAVARAASLAEAAPAAEEGEEEDEAAQVRRRRMTIRLGRL